MSTKSLERVLRVIGLGLMFYGLVRGLGWEGLLVFIGFVIFVAVSVPIDD